MRGLTSNFEDQLVLVAAAALAVLIAAGIASRKGSRERGRRLAARILAGGSALVVVLATAVGPIDPDGDLVLRPGGAGLGDLDQILADPNSLAGVLLVSNVLLYLPVTLFGRLGWPEHPGRVLLFALLLAISIETAQFLWLGRVASTDDVLLNFLGATIGFLAGSWLIRRRLDP